MLRITVRILLCAIIIAGSAVIASAGRILVNIDTGTRGLPVTLNVRDAEVTEILSELFAATDNHYRIHLGMGIRGKIERFQCAEQPFDDALRALLLRANADYTFAKQGAGVYRVFSTKPEDIVVPVISLPVPHKKDDMIVIKATLPPIEKKEDASGNKDDTHVNTPPTYPPGLTGDPRMSPYTSPYYGTQPYYRGIPYTGRAPGQPLH